MFALVDCDDIRLPKLEMIFVCICLQRLQDWKGALDVIHQVSWYSLCKTCFHQTYILFCICVRGD